MGSNAGAAVGTLSMDIVFSHSEMGSLHTEKGGKKDSALGKKTIHDSNHS